MSTKAFVVAFQILSLSVIAMSINQNTYAKGVINSLDERILKVLDSGELIIKNDKLSTLELKSIDSGKALSLAPALPNGFNYKATKAITLARDEKKVLVLARIENSLHNWGDLIYIFDFSTKETEWIIPPPVDSSAYIHSVASAISNRTLTRIIFSGAAELTPEPKPVGTCTGGAVKSESCLYQATFKNKWRLNFLPNNPELKDTDNSEMSPSVSEISDSGGLHPSSWRVFREVA